MGKKPALRPILIKVKEIMDTMESIAPIDASSPNWHGVINDDDDLRKAITFVIYAQSFVQEMLQQVNAWNT